MSIVLGVLAPLITGVFLGIGGRKLSLPACKFCAIVGFLVPLVIGIISWIEFPRGSSQFAFVTDTDLGLKLFGFTLKLGLNNLSLVMWMLAAIVGLSAALYAIQSKIENIRFYLVLLSITQFCVLGTYASINLFFIYFFHEIALIPMFFAMGLWGGAGKRQAAIETAAYWVTGAVIGLAGLLWIYIVTGAKTTDFIVLLDEVQRSPIPAIAQKNIMGLILLGFGMLISLFPLHSWAPRAYVAAPSSFAMLHAGIIKNVAVYYILQILIPLLPMGFMYWEKAVMWLAMGNILIVGMVTMAQLSVKKMVAFSSVMHMGYIILGLFVAASIGYSGIILLIFGHGLSVALMFLLSTSICSRTETYNMNEMGGLCQRMPILCGFFVAGSMAVLGLPGFANFWGELAILVALWQKSPLLTAMAALGLIISTVYSLRAISKIFFGKLQLVNPIQLTPDLNKIERTAAIILLVPLLLVGFYPKLISSMFE